MTDEIDIKHKILTDTAEIPWSDLQTIYAKGLVIWVSGTLDLLEVAADFAADNTTTIEAWLTSGEVQKMSDEKAKQWSQTKPTVWASVIAPWVLVQDKSDSEILNTTHLQ
jgi:hypothetical protein